MNLSPLKLMRTAFGWLAAKFPMRNQKKSKVRQLMHYHPLMFRKL